MSYSVKGLLEVYEDVGMMTRPRVQSCSMATQENGSELQQEFDKGTIFNIFQERIMCEALDDMKVVSASEDDVLPTSDLQMTLYKCRGGRRSLRPGRPSRYHHHKVQNGDRSRQDKSDDKQPKWLPKRDQGERG